MEKKSWQEKKKGGLAVMEKKSWQEKKNDRRIEEEERGGGEGGTSETTHGRGG